MVQKLNFVVSQYIHDKQITSWLVRSYDFYSCFSSKEIRLFRFFFSRFYLSVALFLVELRQLVTYFFVFSFATFLICGHDNLSKLDT